ncbi:unnamed protein product [Rhodiola kirilowii]
MSHTDNAAVYNSNSPIGFHWFCPQTGIYTSLNPTVQLPSHPDIDVVTFMFSQKHDGDTALIDSATGYSISYSHLFPLVQSMAFGLIQMGIRKGDVVLILLPNSVLFPLLFLSVLYAGGVATAMSPLSTDFEIQKQVTHANVKLGFCGVNHLEKLKNMGVSTIEVPQSFGSNRDLMEYCNLFKPKGDAGSVKIKKPVIYQDDAAAILYSSGTTGTSKGVVLSHRNLIATVELFVRFEASKYDELSSSNVYLAALPMFHIYGLSLFVLGLLSLGSRVVVMSKFNIDEAVRAIDRFKVTHFPVVPPILSALAAKAKNVYTIRLRSLKQVCVGASVTPKKVIDDFVQALPHVDLIQAYGMTESSAVATCGFNTRNICKYLSAGLLAPNMQAKVVDWVTGSLLSPGMTGELWLKGPGIMKGYLNDEKSTREVIDKDGWLRTGDIVFFDNDGYLYIVDRLKEIIKYKGFQIAPGDLEDVLISHPEIDDAAVTAAKDELAGEIPVAFVVRTQGSLVSQTAVMDYVAQKVAPYKKVRRVIFVDSIPRSPTGKILRRKLRSDLISKI